MFVLDEIVILRCLTRVTIGMSELPTQIEVGAESGSIILSDLIIDHHCQRCSLISYHRHRYSVITCHCQFFCYWRRCSLITCQCAHCSIFICHCHHSSPISLLVRAPDSWSKGVSSNPGGSGGRIFFSRVNIVYWLLFGVRSTPVLPHWHV